MRTIKEALYIRLQALLSFVSVKITCQLNLGLDLLSIRHCIIDRLHLAIDCV